MLSALEPLRKGTEELPAITVEQHTVKRATELLALGPAHFPALIVMQHAHSNKGPGQRQEVASFITLMRQQHPIAEVPVMVLNETEEESLPEDFRG